MVSAGTSAAAVAAVAAVAEDSGSEPSAVIEGRQRSLSALRLLSSVMLGDEKPSQGTGNGEREREREQERGQESVKRKGKAGGWSSRSSKLWNFGTLEHIGTGTSTSTGDDER
jgi:hypothetical protein